MSTIQANVSVDPLERPRVETQARTILVIRCVERNRETGETWYELVAPPEPAQQELWR